MWEFIHTSVRAGLQPHTSGFCPVAWTNGLPPSLIPLLEQLSAYRFLYPAAEDPQGVRSPVEYSYRRAALGGRILPIVGRIAGTRLDYSGRLNRIAHLLILEDGEIPDGPDGAAAICRAADNFNADYQGPPRLLPLRPLYRAPSSNSDEVWTACRLDPHWADAAAAHFLSGGKEPFYCFFPPGFPAETLLELIASIIRRLPEPERRRFTFSTYYAQNTPGCDCYFRCAVADGSTPLPKFYFSVHDPAPVPPEWLPEEDEPCHLPDFGVKAPEAAERPVCGAAEGTVGTPPPRPSGIPLKAGTRPALSPSPVGPAPDARPPDRKRPARWISAAAIILSLTAIVLAAVDLWVRRQPGLPSRGCPAPAGVDQRRSSEPVFPATPAAAHLSDVARKPPEVPPEQPLTVAETSPAPEPQKPQNVPPPVPEKSVWQVTLSTDPEDGAVWSFRKVSGPPDPAWRDWEVSAAFYLNAVRRESEAGQRTGKAKASLESEKEKMLARQQKLQHPEKLSARELKVLNRAQKAYPGKKRHLESALKQLQKDERDFRRKRRQRARNLLRQIEEASGLRPTDLPTLARMLTEGGVPTPEIERRCEADLAALRRKGTADHAER